MIKRILFSIFLSLCLINPIWAADGDRVIEGITADKISTIALDVTGVTDGNIPYMQAAGAGFGDSLLSQSGTTLTDSGDLTVSGGDLVLGTSSVAGNITQHDAGITTFYDDGDNTSVVIGPVADGTTILGLTGSLNISGTATAISFTADPSATPSVDFYDSDAADGDINARIQANATTTGSGVEVVDMDFQAQGAASAGVLGTFMSWDGSTAALLINGAIQRIALKPNTTTASPTTYADDATIASTYSLMRVVGNGGAVMLDTDPAIADGVYDGQELRIQGCHDTNLVTIATACNTKLTGGISMSLGLHDFLVLTWDAGQSLWVELYRVNN